MKVSFVGMSHLGLVYSMAFASKGYEVLCFDRNQALVQELSQGIFPISEPDLELLFRQVKTKISFTSDVSKLSDSDIVYLSHDVPTNDDGISDLSIINSLIADTQEVISTESILVILCQVYPGFTREVAANVDCVLLYQVETLVFGQAVQRALNPERIIIGTPNESQVLPCKIEEVLNSFECRILTMSYESAELTKIAINIFLAATLSTANTMSELSEKLRANWNDISAALQLDPRIGTQSYLRPGLGISGGNIERDLKTTLDLAVREESHHQMINAILENSKYRKLWPTRILRQELEQSAVKSKIAIWGLAYKKNTNSTKNSPTIENIKHLKTDFEISLSDPIASLPEFLDREIIFSRDPMSILTGAKALLILTDWDLYSQFEIDQILSCLSRPLIIDPHGVLKCRDLSRVEYFTLGQ
jgi:UDPglucose 6-dehydrogenase